MYEVVRVHVLLGCSAVQSAETPSAKGSDPMDTIVPLSPPLARDVQLYAIGFTIVHGLGAGCELLGTAAQACGFQLRRAAKASGGD